MRKYLWLFGLCLLAGCSESHSPTKSLPTHKAVAIVVPSFPNPPRFVPFVSATDKKTAIAVQRLVHQTDLALASTRSALRHLQEERMASPIAPPGPDVLEPGLAVPMPKVRVTNTH